MALFWASLESNEGENSFQLTVDAFNGTERNVFLLLFRFRICPRGLRKVEIWVLLKRPEAILEKQSIN